MDFNSWTLTSFGNQSIKKSDVLSPVPNTPKLPKIVLRNSMGFELKTETTFQNAIYRAKTKLLEPNRRLTEMEWRLPHAPVPSRPDYSRSLEYDDFRSMKKPPKMVDPHKTEHMDMSFWDYLLPDRRLDQATVSRRTMEKYYRSMDTVPHPEFMDNFHSLKRVEQIFLSIVSTSSTLDKVVADLGIMDNRKKMIMTQVLTSLLKGDFASLENLPANVRNDALLDLAKLAREGKLSVAMQEKVLTELAQNLSALPPEVRAKVTEQLINCIENVPPEAREQVVQQILNTLETLSEEDRQKVLHDLVKKISSMPEESRNALIEKIMENMDNLTPDAKIQLLQDLLRDADTIPAAMRDNILQNLLDSLDTLPPGERERVLAELTKNLATLPPNIRQQLLEKLLEKSEELPPELRDQMYAEILKNVPGMPEELKRKLVVELLKNVDNMDPTLRQNVMKEILNNLDLIDDTMHGQVLQNFLQSLNDVPADERDAILKKIIEKSAALDDPEMKRQLLEEILKNPSNLSASALQELVKNVGELPPDLQERLYAEILQKKDELSPSVLEEIIRNSANVPQAVLKELIKDVEKLAPSSLAELAKHLNVLPEEVRTKLLADVMNSMNNLDDEQKAALIGELLKNQTNLNPQQLETLMKNLDGLDPALKEKVMKGLVDNMDNLPPAVKEKLIQDLLNKDSDLDQETRVKMLAKLLENPENLTQEEREKVLNQLMQEIDNVKDPEMKKKLLNDMLSNLKDLPPETMTQLLSNINDLPPSEQKELLKQILEKFDELPPEMKEKLVDDLLKSAAGMPAEVQKQMITDLLNEMKDLSAEERTKLMEKVLDNPNLDPAVRAKLIEEMLKTANDLPPEERQKLLEKMLENSDQLDPKTKAKLMEQMLKTLDDLPNEERQKVLSKMLDNSDNLTPAMRNKLMDEMIKNINQMPPEEREKFLADLVNDPDKKDLLKELLNNGQLSNEMKKKIVDEMTKKPIDPSTLLSVLKNSKEIPPEILEKVLQSVENMSAKELNELAKNLNSLPPEMKQRVMKEMMKNIRDLDSKTQANIVRELLGNAADMDPKILSDIIKNVTNLTPTAIKELFIKADKLPPEALKELLKHMDEIPVNVLEELVKNVDQLSPEVIAALLASKNLPPAIREKLMQEINSNKKIKDKLRTLDPLTKGVEGVGKVVPKPKPEVKKPKVDLPPVSKKVSKKLEELYGRLFGKESGTHLDADMEILANIDESELEGLLQDPEFLNLDPNLPPEVRRQLIEEIRKKRAKQRIIDVPPLSKDKLQEIDDPLDYLYKYCIIHPDRMANYERVFLNAVKKQKPKFEGQNPPESTTKLINLKRNNTDGGVWTNVGGGKYIHDTKQYHALDSSDEDEDIDKPNITKQRNGPNMVNFEKEIRDGAFDPDVPPMKSETAQKLDKINFIIDDLRKKEAEITQTQQTTNEQITRMTAEAIMDLYPEILDPEYDPKKKKQKTSEKTIGELKSYGSLYTTEQLLTRLSKSQIQIVNGQTEIKQLNGQANWSKNKLVQLRMRIEMLLGERESLLARDQEERQQTMYKYKRVEKFRRQQSPLWNALHPSIDYEMNIEELEKALRQINGNLISPKECQYIKFILKIPGIKRINLKVFSIIAALSEKVNQIEPFVRKLINKFDYDALDIKMQKAKDLFYLMADKSQKLAPKGYVPLRALCVELAAGGVERDNIENCKKKFDREGKNYVDFMDWLIYVPLFVEIHTRIVSNPFLRYEDPLKPPKESEK
ncbi:unnamed protein product [Rotaria sp. Silwood1]|nr:unnamed protein product [Rotaria sp. Silwood1]CAF1464918.1 unnamed protein product [Rotaria sp. Silwood1]CAF3556853.1 unnamed protein product [Rotaria sp. Silwood1]CAF4513680.1 unnamed protein product [Rotaria sp. Silwood1]